MQKLKFIISLVLFTFILNINILVAQYETEEPYPENYPPSEDLDTQDEEKMEEADNKICPVDFKKITQENKVAYEYEGKMYNFDSALCIENFKKDPEKYLSEWEKKERFRKINIIYD